MRSAHTFSLASLLASLLALPVLPAHAANVQATAAGGVAASYALEMPPGVNGHAPGMALAYSSGNGNATAGYGWALNGGQLISRCGSILSLDGATGGVSGGVNDHLCLGGMRLVRVHNTTGAPQLGLASGDAAGLAAGAYSEFRPASGPYSRIRAYGRADGSSIASGPAWLRAWTKEGLIVDFGASPSADANTNSLLQPIRRATAQVPTPVQAAQGWAVTRAADRSGNVLDYKYAERTSALGSQEGWNTSLEVTLKEIQYAGNKVVLAYADQPTSGTPRAYSERYDRGVKNLVTQRLANITTYVNSANPGSLGPAAGAVAVRTYKLTHTQHATTNQSMLSSVAMCAGGPTSTYCQPATRFEYTSGPNGAFEAVSGFNLSTTALGPWSAHGVMPLVGDFNGDGRADFLQPDIGASPANKLYLSNGNGNFSLAATSGLASAPIAVSSGCVLSQVLDMNGDTLDDILLTKANNGDCVSETVTPKLLTNLGGNAFSTASLTGPALGIASPLISYSAGYGSSRKWTQGNTYFLLDVNRDSRVDIVTTLYPAQTTWWDPASAAPNPCASTVCTRVWLNTADGTFTEAATNFANKSVYRSVGTRVGGADLNSDGLTDIVTSPLTFSPIQNHVINSLSRGDGNFDVGSTVEYGCMFALKNQRGMLLDYNGDGQSDCLIRATEGNVLFQPNASPDLAEVDVTNFNLVSAELTRTAADFPLTAVPLDANADGRTDILSLELTNNATNRLLLSDGAGQFFDAPAFNLDTLNPLDAVFGDFLGTGSVALLKFTTGPMGVYSHQLYALAGYDTPPGLLRTVIEPSGARTVLAYSLPASADTADSFAPRYVSDRGTGSAATGAFVDVPVVGPLLASISRSTGVGDPATNLLAVQYKYYGAKAHRQYGSAGFRSVRELSYAANGTSVTTIRDYSQAYPHTGQLVRERSYSSALTGMVAADLRTEMFQLHCDYSNSAAERNSALAADLSCPDSAAALRRPYVLRKEITAHDDAGVAVTSTTVDTAVHVYGDALQVSTTARELGSGGSTYVNSVSNAYFADDISCSAIDTCKWLVSRLQNHTETDTAPGKLLGTSAGTGAHASATSGSATFNTASLGAVAFGNLSVDATTTRLATLTNTGANSLSLTPPTAASVSGADFSFVSTTCSASLAPSGTCTVTVRFSPSNNVPRTGTLAIATGAGSKTAALSGTGIQGTSSLSVSSLSFAGRTVGTLSPAQSAVLTNVGSDVLTVSGVTLTAGAADFDLSHDCSTLAVNASCTATVTFSPSASGMRSGTLVFAANSSNGNSTVSLSGEGIPASASLSVPALANAKVGATSSATATFTNTGAAATRVTVPTAGSVSGADFSFVSTTCPTSLAASASCTVTVRFAPTDNVARTGTLSVTSSAGVKTVALSATGLQGAGTYSPSSLAFASRNIGTTSAAQAITVTNNGNATLVVSSVSFSAGAADYDLTENCATLAIGASCTVNVSFTPSASGSRPGTLLIASDASNGNRSIALSGTGIQPLVVLTVSGPSTTDWTFVNPNPVAVTPSAVGRDGTGTVGVSGVNATGTTCISGTAIAAGASCVVRLRAPTPLCRADNYTVRPYVTIAPGTTYGDYLSRTTNVTTCP